jgi:S1-C subfamily serine protease
MRKILALLLSAALLVGAYKERAQANRFIPFESRAKSASGAIFVNKDGHRQFDCSGTEIGHTNDGGGIFLTARHCVADFETNEFIPNETVSFGANEGGPYYDAAPIALSLTDDVALLYLRNGANIPEVKIKDEGTLSSGDPIFNVSFPLGIGKNIFHVEFMAPRFPFLSPDILEKYNQWTYSMPMNLTIANGSSGSGVFSQKDHALIGVAVGSFGEGSFNIAIPASRIIGFLNHLDDNTVAKFIAAFPPQPDVMEFF